jgi:hypothetical protein
LQEKTELVRFNASLENPLATVSIPQFIIDESARKRALETHQEGLPKKHSVWERLGPKECGGENSPTGRFQEDAEAGYVIYELDESFEEVWIDEETHHHSALGPEINQESCLLGYCSLMFNMPFHFQP